MICEICGKTHAKVRYVTRSYGKGASLLVIENIPVISCPDCGETYLTAETLHQIDKIKTGRRRASDKRPVSVAKFVQPHSN